MTPDTHPDDDPDVMTPDEMRHELDAIERQLAETRALAARYDAERARADAASDFKLQRGLLRLEHTLRMAHGPTTQALRETVALGTTLDRWACDVVPRFDRLTPSADAEADARDRRDALVLLGEIIDALRAIDLTPRQVEVIFPYLLSSVEPAALRPAAQRGVIAKLRATLAVVPDALPEVL